MTIYGINRSEIDKGDIWNTVEVANNGHPRDWLKYPSCTDDRYTKRLFKPFRKGLPHA